MSRVMVVTFDLDDTLWDVGEVLRTAETETRAWMADHAPAVAALMTGERWPALRQQILTAHPDLDHDVTALRLAVLHEAARRCGYSARDARRLADGAFAVFLDARHRVALFDGARDVLELLARRYRLGALSNGNADVHRLGMEDVFGFRFSAADVGARKPDPAMFHAALVHTGVAPAQMVHVGDHPRDDIGGAARAGVASLWVNYDGVAFPAGHAAPTMTVRRLAEIPERLREYERER